MKKIINWKIFTILLILSLLSVVAVFPYVATVQAEVLQLSGLPIITIFVVQMIQSAVMFSFAIFVGLILCKKINFHLPILEDIVVKKSNLKLFKATAILSILLGGLVALAIYLTDKIFTLLGTSISTSESIAPIWQKLLASFYGGIAEEVLMRLFLMTFFIWVIMKLTRSKKPSNFGIICSIVLAAIIFGLGHLPITSTITSITPLVVTRAIILNGIGGVVFGLLFWKKGLESAIMAHFTDDVFLLTLLPLVLG